MHRRLPRLLSYSLMAAVPALGALVGLGPAASASTAASTVATPPSPGAQAAAAARSALKQLVIGQHATDHPVSGHVRMINGLTQVSSTNWSGYADDNSSGNTYNKVSGNWTEPSASCTSTESLAAFWVGITLKVTDSTHPANSFTTTQTCTSCVDTSAESIAEAPSGSSGVYPLSNFHSWSTSGASVTSGSTTGRISSFPDDELTMINNSGSVKAQPGPLGGGGSTFIVTWDRSS